MAAQHEAQLADAQAKHTHDFHPWKELSWDQAHCRYLMGLYYATWPWMREFVNVNRLGLPVIKIWAYDHICQFGWPVPLPTTDDRSFIY